LTEQNTPVYDKFFTTDDMLIVAAITF